MLMGWFTVRGLWISSWGRFATNRANEESLACESGKDRQVANGCDQRSSGGSDDDGRAREPSPTATAEPSQTRSADTGTAGGVNRMLNDCQGLEGRHVEPSRTAQCVGPSGLFLNLTIAYRGLSQPRQWLCQPLRACSLAGSHRARLAVFTP